MHIRQMGAGGKTIVLLPGHNLPLPSVELALLMRDLAQKNTVCIVEYFGYGHSDPIDTIRTNKNYVQEMREGLAGAGLVPPYVLMPYSASGIHAEYYAAMHPEEVAGLILLDATPSVAAVVREWEWTSHDMQELKREMATYVPPTEDDIKEAIEEDLPGYLKYGYTREELEEIYTTPNHKLTILAQDLSASDNMRDVMTLHIPKSIPVFAIYSDLADADDAERAKWFARRKEHMARLGDHMRHVTIEGSTHGNITCHPEYRRAVSQEVNTFLLNLY